MCYFVAGSFVLTFDMQIIYQQLYNHGQYSGKKISMHQIAKFLGGFCVLWMLTSRVAFAMELDDEYIKTRLSVAARYVKGEDVPQKEEIFQWTLTIAHNGHPEAQYLIGKMYLASCGVPQSIDDAYVWFNKASTQGHVLAQLNCKRIENSQSFLQAGIERVEKKLQGIAGDVEEIIVGVEEIKLDGDEVKAGTRTLLGIALIEHAAEDVGRFDKDSNNGPFIKTSSVDEEQERQDKKQAQRDAEALSEVEDLKKQLTAMKKESAEIKQRLSEEKRALELQRAAEEQRKAAEEERKRQKAQRAAEEKRALDMQRAAEEQRKKARQAEEEQQRQAQRAAEEKRALDMQRTAEEAQRRASIPQIARGHENIYERFLKGKLVYRPTEGSDVGKIELPIAALANPLEGTFDLSRCGDAAQYLSINTGIRKVQAPANASKVEIWFTPLFLVS